jgi:tripartite-type tricarboxylate transporter receptor subunit TctC
MTRAILRRRQLLPLAAASTMLSGLSIPARADTYPSQAINFIIPYSPGGSFDSYVRCFTEFLQQGLPKKVYVEPINVPGAGGRAAVVQLLQDPPDGYNISIISIPGILMSTKAGMPDLDKLTWIANLGRDSYGLAVGKSSAIKSVADLQTLSAQRKLKFSSSGSGSTDYFATKVFASALGLRVNLVLGYNDSSDSIIAVARGDVDCVVHSLSVLKQMESQGFARILFVFQEKSPIPGVEDATAINKPDLGEIFQWRPIGGPPNLPPEIVSLLSDILVKAAKSDAAQKWAAGIGSTLYPLNHEETLAMIKTQEELVAKWRFALS